MSTFMINIDKLIGWITKLGEDAMRYNRNPDVQHSHLFPPAPARKKATKLIDEKIFGIGRKKGG